MSDPLLAALHAASVVKHGDKDTDGPLYPHKRRGESASSWAKRGAKAVAAADGKTLPSQNRTTPEVAARGGKTGAELKANAQKAKARNLKEQADNAAQDALVQRAMNPQGLTGAERKARAQQYRNRPNKAQANAAFAKINPKGSKDGAGTVDDPIDVGDDLDLAVKLLSEGKHVRLAQNKEVATLIDKLAKLVDEASKKGDKAPDIDLCMVSVPGTNLFCHDNKGIPRAQMPQFKGKAKPGSKAGAKVDNNPDMEADIEKDFREALGAMGVKITPKTVPAAELRATQSQLDGKKVAGMVTARQAGEFPDEKWDKPIYVTRDGYIIDGHHRWAAKVGVDLQDGTLGDEPMAVEIVDMDIGTAIDFSNAFALSMGLIPKGTGAAAEGVGKGDRLDRIAKLVARLKEERDDARAGMPTPTVSAR